RRQYDGGVGSAAAGDLPLGRGVERRVRGRVRRGDGPVSAPLVPNLFAVCKVLVAAILSIVQQLIYALSGPIPPLRGLGDFVGSDPIVSIVTWLIVVTVVVLWVTVINLFTVMWVERKLYS